VKNCTNCGTSNADEAQVCTNCGAPLPAAAQPAPPPQAAMPPPPPGYAQPGMPPPPPGYAQQGYAAGPKPNIQNYLVWSIITTLCCCLPLGIFGIIKSAEVNTKIAAGDYVGAEESAKTAKTVNLIGTIVGAVFGVFWIIVQVFAVIASQS
jgi:hypothetical protein